MVINEIPDSEFQRQQNNGNENEDIEAIRIDFVLGPTTKNLLRFDVFNKESDNEGEAKVGEIRRYDI